MSTWEAKTPCHFEVYSEVCCRRIHDKGLLLFLPLAPSAIAYDAARHWRAGMLLGHIFKENPRGTLFIEIIK